MMACLYLFAGADKATWHDNYGFLTSLFPILNTAS